MTDARRAPAWRLVATVLTGIVVFGALSMLAVTADDQNEQRLLDRQTEESATVLELRIARILTPIENAAEVAEATGGDPDTFARLLGPRVSDTYASMTLIDRATGARISTVGAEPVVDDIDPDAIGEAIERTADEHVVVIDMLGEDRRLGYVVASDPTNSRYAVYYERVLDEVANERRLFDGPFQRLDYALYLGDGEEPANLIAASGVELPITGRRSSALIDYGDTVVTMITSPTAPLGSPLMNNLWWIVLLNGVAATVVTTYLLHRLGRRRDEAVRLARENAARHHEQRDIAETLQLSLLPDRLSPPPSSELASRYWTAGAANLIGGDFYDAFQIDDRRWGILIGDVCGKGIESAALIGLVRHTVRASAMYTDSPAAALFAVHKAMTDHNPPTFCTAAFMIYSPDTDDVLDTEAGMGTLLVALAGHPQPILAGGDGVAHPIGSHGTLLGMIDPHIADQTVRIRSGDTLMLYTDGLTDAPRGQAVSLDELVDVMSTAHEHQLNDLADGIRSIKRSRRPGGSTDDTAVLVLRFQVAKTAEIPPEPVAQMRAVDV